MGLWIRVAGTPACTPNDDARVAFSGPYIKFNRMRCLVMYGAGVPVADLEPLMCGPRPTDTEAVYRAAVEKACASLPGLRPLLDHPDDRRCIRARDCRRLLPALVSSIVIASRNWYEFGALLQFIRGVETAVAANKSLRFA